MTTSYPHLMSRASSTRRETASSSAIKIRIELFLQRIRQDKAERPASNCKTRAECPHWSSTRVSHPLIAIPQQLLCPSCNCCSRCYDRGRRDKVQDDSSISSLIIRLSSAHPAAHPSWQAA